MKYKNDFQIYVGLLSKKTTKIDLEKEFSKYGKVQEIIMKEGYAFIVNIFRIL